MQTTVELPKAFSVRDECEFFPVQHLMARMNPGLRVARVASGVHVNGGSTVFWGVIHLDGHPLSKKDVETALREAGFDVGHNLLVRTSDLWTGCAKEAAPSETK